MKKIRNFLYWLVQWTWGFPQTLIGAIFFLVCRKNPNCIYHGSVVTKWNYQSSVSLGMFIFAYEDIEFEHNGVQMPNAESFQRLVTHEYGHTIQSLIVGPLYLLLVGIPSMLWGILGYRARVSKNIPYSKFFTEKTANIFGEKITKEKSIEDIVF